ncbi:UNVERIFIED_CONTAM: Magnesium transporter MRS2-I [Sesamum calycinum]|uniref:Magnesium transporter MRS2-I n=1 Tax=Sesamum calycinum TaxID=2727403 RepID=A0AAW2R965_9LAMI
MTGREVGHVVLADAPNAVSLAGFKKKGVGSRSWILMDSSGQEIVLDVDKYAIMHRVQIHARDLRILDPLLSYPSTILGRERAIVLNLEVKVKGPPSPNSPFEFRALEVALEAICSYLAARSIELESAVYPALDMLTSKISSRNLDRVRKLKSQMTSKAPFSSAVFALSPATTPYMISFLQFTAFITDITDVRDELEQLLDDDDDMADLYLSRKLAAAPFE